MKPVFPLPKGAISLTSGKRDIGLLVAPVSISKPMLASISQSHAGSQYHKSLLYISKSMLILPSPQVLLLLLICMVCPPPPLLLSILFCSVFSCYFLYLLLSCQLHDSFQHSPIPSLATFGLFLPALALLEDSGYFLSLSHNIQWYVSSFFPALPHIEYACVHICLRTCIVCLCMRTVPEGVKGRTTRLQSLHLDSPTVAFCHCLL